MTEKKRRKTKHKKLKKNVIEKEKGFVSAYANSKGIEREQ